MNIRIAFVYCIIPLLLIIGSMLNSAKVLQDVSENKTVTLRFREKEIVNKNSELLVRLLSYQEVLQGSKKNSFNEFCNKKKKLNEIAFGTSVVPFDMARCLKKVSRLAAKYRPNVKGKWLFFHSVFFLLALLINWAVFAGCERQKAESISYDRWLSQFQLILIPTSFLLWIKPLGQGMSVGAYFLMLSFVISFFQYFQNNTYKKLFHYSFAIFIILFVSSFYFYNLSQFGLAFRVFVPYATIVSICNLDLSYNEIRKYAIAVLLLFCAWHALELSFHIHHLLNSKLTQVNFLNFKRKTYDSNMLAQNLLAMLGVSMALFTTSKHRAQYIFLLLTIGGLLILTVSRAALLALAAFVFFYFLEHKKVLSRNKLRWVYLAFVLLISVLWVAVAEFITFIPDGSFGTKFTIYYNFKQMLAESSWKNLLFGYGLSPFNSTGLNLKGFLGHTHYYQIIHYGGAILSAAIISGYWLLQKKNAFCLQTTMLLFVIIGFSYVEVFNLACLFLVPLIYCVECYDEI